MQITRLVEMIYILLRRKTVTAAELAEQFGISVRTVYRDVDALSLSGIPIYTEKGRGGGIRLLPNFILDKSLLNESEQQEILTALQSLSSVQAAETDRVLTKLSAVFNKNTTNWLGVDFTDWNCSNGNIFYGLKTAILELRIITFDYYSVMGEKTKRRAEPVQLWFKHRAWYLKAFCLTRMEERLFKLNRLQNLTVTDERFIKRYIPARLEKESNEETVQVSGKSNIITEVTLVLRFTERVAYRVYDEFGGDITGREEDGSFIVKVTWPEDDWVYGTILSYGENVEVLEPERMRGLIRAKAERIVKKYEKK